MLVSRIGMMSEAPIDLTSENGYFYQNLDKDLEIVILDWLDGTPESMNETQIQKFLMEAAVHLEIHTQQLMEENIEDTDA